DQATGSQIASDMFNVTCSYRGCFYNTGDAHLKQVVYLLQKHVKIHGVIIPAPSTPPQPATVNKPTMMLPTSTKLAATKVEQNTPQLAETEGRPHATENTPESCVNESRDTPENPRSTLDTCWHKPSQQLGAPNTATVVPTTVLKHTMTTEMSRPPTATLEHTDPSTQLPPVTSADSTNKKIHIQQTTHKDERKQLIISKPEAKKTISKKPPSKVAVTAKSQAYIKPNVRKILATNKLFHIKRSLKKPLA
ncbi:unnamed protein product, partial [Meganyctiphanes norvegica]